MPTFNWTEMGIIFAAIAWTLPWKALALWKSARRGEKGWFLAPFLLNTLAILEILYLFVFSEKNKEKNDNKN